MSCETATAVVETVGTGGGSSATIGGATERGRVSDGDAEGCDCAKAEELKKREAETAIKAKIFFILYD